MKFRTTVFVTIATAWCGVLPGPVAVVRADVQEIMADIERASSLEGETYRELAKSIFTRANQDTAGLASAILPKLAEGEVNDKLLGLYIGTLGCVRATEAVDDICRILRQTSLEPIKQLCQNVLVSIGNDASSACLLTSLDQTTDSYERFKIYNLLGQMQYEGAFPGVLELLDIDPDEYYWKALFVFGKMGDVAVPSLIEKVNDKSRNVRRKSIFIVGSWLLAPAAKEPLEVQFWNESDPEIRVLILNSLAAVTSNIDSLIHFMEQVESEAKDEKSRTFASETIEQFTGISALLEPMRETKMISPDLFNSQYDAIWESFGVDGDYEVLLGTSTLQDEPALKKLRERILQRNCDDAFLDFRKVNDIIVINRLLARN